MEPWIFGVEPLEQTTAVAARLRRLTGLLLAAEDDDPAVDRLLAALDEAEAALAARLPADLEPRVGAAARGGGRVYVDHGRDIGAYNPAFPDYDLTVDETRATGTVTFPIAYEGPAGFVHGGFLALFADCIAQHHNCEVGVAGKTVSLSIRYRRPAPLLTTLAVAAERRVEGSRIHSNIHVLDGDRLLCEAELEAVAGERDAMPEVSPRRRGQ
ncbi:MAG TPA: PaaI family thioesterase [Acidimicrobiales bacterium]